ncbi:MAG TPA: DUF3300 domain-containing protein [Pseudolabrys sp.]|nr:DUF3300 domain-containing protein [Pseudolabrys sp.]
MQAPAPVAPAQAEAPAAIPQAPVQTEAAAQPQDRLSTKPKDQQRLHQQTPIGQAELDQILAPIALYPDNLLAQVMTASTYPLEVVMAARWTKEHPGVKGDALDQAMQQQPWDPSVKGLTAVPQVLAMMSDKLDWMEQLGEAFLAQPDDVTKTVQRLRAKAEATGNLKTTEQIKVKKVKAPAPPPPPPGAPAPAVMAEEPDYIEIEPAAPDVVYVPVYNPVVVYGAWPYPVYRPFFWYPPGYVYAGGIGFGAGFVVGAALWCHYDWYHRSVWIDTRRYNRFNHAHLTGSRARWTHNPNHRGIVPYKNAKLQQTYSHSRFTPGAMGKPNARVAPKATARSTGHVNTGVKPGTRGKPAAVAKRNTGHPGATAKPLHRASTPRSTHTATPRALPRTAAAQPMNRTMARPVTRPRNAPARGGNGSHGRY